MPVLYEVFRVLGVPEEVRIQLCVGTSLAIIVPTTIRSYQSHRETGIVVEGIVRLWWLPALIGVGSRLGARRVRAAALCSRSRSWSCATIIAAKLLFGRADWRLGEDLPPGLAGKALGFPGRARLRVDGCQRRLDLEHDPDALRQDRCIRPSRRRPGLGVPITIAGTIGYMLAGLPQQSLMPPLSIGFVSLIGFALMAPVSSFTATYGARLAHALPKRKLEIAFGIFLLLVSVRFIASLV